MPSPSFLSRTSFSWGRVKSIRLIKRFFCSSRLIHFCRRHLSVRVHSILKKTKKNNKDSQYCSCRMERDERKRARDSDRNNIRRPCNFLVQTKMGNRHRASSTSFPMFSPPLTTHLRAPVETRSNDVLPDS